MSAGFSQECPTAKRVAQHMAPSQLWTTTEKKLLLSSFSWFVFSGDALLPWLSTKLVDRRKTPRMQSLSSFFCFLFLPNASLTWEDREHFEETMYTLTHTPHTHTHCFSQIQHWVYSLGGVFQSKITVRACACFDTDSRRDGVVWHWCILTEIDCSICGSIFSAPRGPRLILLTRWNSSEREKGKK